MHLSIHLLVTYAWKPQRHHKSYMLRNGPTISFRKHSPPRFHISLHVTSAQLSKLQSLESLLNQPLLSPLCLINQLCIESDLWLLPCEYLLMHPLCSNCTITGGGRPASPSQSYFRKHLKGHSPYSSFSRMQATCLLKQI